MNVLGLDIGGASIKAATSRGWAASHRFPLWRDPARLAGEVASLIRGIDHDLIAVTMTGELCDGFETKEEGVARILESVGQVVSQGTDILVWQTTGRFVSPATAIQFPWETASANWLALATYASTFAEKPNAILIDIGSTTTDVVAFREGKPTPVGRTDPDRLASGELVYHGVRRTPVCAILASATISGIEYPLMAELFASSLDAYLVLGLIDEDPSSTETADGRPETKRHAIDRLSRMIGSDRSRFSADHATEIATQIADRQRKDVRRAVERVAARAGFEHVDLLLTSGEGEFLIDSIAENCEPIRHSDRVSLSSRHSKEISRAACAYAVACLAEKVMS